MARLTDQTLLPNPPATALIHVVDPTNTTDHPDGSSFKTTLQAIADLVPPADSVPPGGTTGQVLTKQSATDGDADWQDPTSGGVTDHGALTGLGDDDHPQYHTDARGDARYFTQAQVTTSLAGKANTTHSHAITDVTGLQTALDGKQFKTYVTVGFSDADYICDGIDDHVQMQSAISEIVSNGGGVMFIKSGVYTNASILTTASADVPIRILGEPGTVINLSGNIGFISHGGDESGTIIERLVINANDSTSTCLQFSVGLHTNTIFRELTIKNVDGVAIVHNGASFTVENCALENVKNGIVSNTSDSGEDRIAWVLNNNITNISYDVNDNEGVDLNWHNSQNAFAHVSNNYISGFRQEALDLNVKSAVVTGNTIVQPTFDSVTETGGILVQSVSANSNAVVTGNMILNVCGQGIQVGINQNAATITGNYVSGASSMGRGYGVRLTGSTSAQNDISVVGNTFDSLNTGISNEISGLPYFVGVANTFKGVTTKINPASSGGLIDHQLRVVDRADFLSLAVFGLQNTTTGALRLDSGDGGSALNILGMTSGVGSITTASSANRRLNINNTSSGRLDVSLEDGFLGVGKTNPGQSLDVVGNGAFTGDVTVQDEAYDATAWNGSLEVPTKNAVRDKIDAMDTAIALNTAKVSNATHTGDVTGATALTLATVNSNVGSFGLAGSVAQFTVNAKGLITAAANVAISITSSAVTDFAATVRATVLTGLSTATSTAVTATDSILVAIGKLQAQNTAQDTAIALNTAKRTYPLADETKLAGIAAGAEVNVNADWNAASGDAQILNKPTIPTQYTDELAQDAVGAMATNSTFVSLTYNDTTPSLTPALSATGTPSATTFLRGDNTWATPPGGGAVDEMTKAVAQTGHGFVVGDLIRHNGTVYVRSQGNNGANAEIVGMVSTVTDANNFTFSMPGSYIEGLSGRTAGETYFLDPTTAGAMTITEPTTAGQIRRPVFFAVSTTAGIFNPLLGIEVTAPGTSLPIGGSNRQVQFNNSGAFAGASNVEIEGNNLRLVATADPSASLANGLNVYASNVAGRILPKIIGPSGIDTALQVGLHGNSIAMFGPSNGAAAPSQWGISLSTAATMSHQHVIASANPWLATRRTRFQTAATAAAGSGCRTAYVQWFRGNATGFGGFWFRSQFGQTLNVNGAQSFVGLCASSAVLATTAGAVSALVNMIGVGYDTTDANTGNWQLFRNDGTGTAVKVDLGANAARNTTHGYDLVMFCPPGAATEIFVRIRNLHTGVVALDTSYNTELPTVNVGLAFKGECNNGAIASAVNLEFAKLYIESDY